MVSATRSDRYYAFSACLEEATDALQRAANLAVEAPILSNRASPDARPVFRPIEAAFAAIVETRHALAHALLLEQETEDAKEMKATRAAVRRALHPAVVAAETPPIV